MYIIIAGSRSINDERVVEEALAESGFPIDVIVQGGARGVDTLAKKYAQKNNLPHIEFGANWNKHGKRAGPIRNAEMVRYAKESCECNGALVAIWDGESRGTFNIITQAFKAGLRVFVKTIINPGPENVARRGKE